MEQVRGQKVRRWHCTRIVLNFMLSAPSSLYLHAFVVKQCTRGTATELRVLCASLFAYFVVNLRYHLNIFHLLQKPHHPDFVKISLTFISWKKEP